MSDHLDQADHGADRPSDQAGVDQVLASLSALDQLPVSDHVAVFERAHEQLRRALDAPRAS